MMAQSLLARDAEGAMPHTLVIGATGYLGRHLVTELQQRGHSVRAVARDRQQAEQSGSWGAPALSGLVDEWSTGDVRDARFVAGLVDGVDAVVSALGASQRAGRFEENLLLAGCKPDREFDDLGFDLLVGEHDRMARPGTQERTEQEHDVGDDDPG